MVLQGVIFKYDLTIRIKFITQFLPKKNHSSTEIDQDCLQCVFSLPCGLHRHNHTHTLQNSPLAAIRHEYEWGGNTQGRAGKSDDSAGKHQSIYGDVWFLSPVTDMIKWLDLNTCVCARVCVWIRPIRWIWIMYWIDRQPPVVVHTISPVCVVFSCPAGRVTGEPHTLCHSPRRGVGACSLFIINQRSKLFNNNKEAVKRPLGSCQKWW